MSDKPTVYSKGRFQLKYRGTECLNCRHPLDVSDRYCPNCSQINSTKKVTIRDFLDEFFSNIIAYDSRLIRTLSAMTIHPGKITRDYIEGRRMTYTNPFRFMLSLAIIYFLMISIGGGFRELDRYGRNLDNFSFDPGEIIALSIDEQNADRDEAIKLLDSLDVKGKIGNFKKERDSLIVHQPREFFTNIKDNSLLARLGKKHHFFTTLLDRDSIYGFQEAIDKYGVANNLENKMSYSMAGSTLRVSRQPGTFVDDLFSKLPFATFFFLPIFALFICLAYIRKKYTYTDNLIFSFHNQSLLFILLIISFLIDEIFNTSTAWIALVVFAFYLYKAMRNFYRQGRFKTIVKYFFLNTVFLILAGFAAIIFVLASAFTY